MISSHARIYAVVNPIEVLGYNPQKYLGKKKIKTSNKYKTKTIFRDVRLYFKFGIEYKNRKIDNINLYLQNKFKKIYSFV